MILMREINDLQNYSYEFIVKVAIIKFVKEHIVYF